MSRDPGLDFSFSGLKTALVYLCRDLGADGVTERRADLAASFQAAAVGQLVAKLERALKRGEWRAVALGGGVAANGPLREAVRELCERRGVALKLVGARALHRQRGDDRLRRPLRRPDPLPRLPRLRRLRHRAKACGRMTQVTVYSRPECHLCAEAVEALVALHAEGYRFELHEVDIESEELLLRRMLEKIPVVEVDGEVVSELLLDEAAVRARLDRVEA